VKNIDDGAGNSILQIMMIVSDTSPSIWLLYLIETALPGFSPVKVIIAVAVLIGLIMVGETFLKLRAFESLFKSFPTNINFTINNAFSRQIAY
jgi:hypothetical protein